jgi:hypothetical protein
MNKTKHPGGRPTDYSPEVLKKAEKYVFSAYKDEMFDEIPTVAGLTVYLKVSRETIYDWAKQESKPQFSGQPRNRQ